MPLPSPTFNRDFEHNRPRILEGQQLHESPDDLLMNARLVISGRRPSSENLKKQHREELDRFDRFDAQLEQMAPHERTGWLISFYTQRKDVQDREVRGALRQLMKKWNGHPSIRENLTPHLIKLAKKADLEFAQYQMRFFPQEAMEQVEGIVVDTRPALRRVAPIIDNILGN